MAIVTDRHVEIYQTVITDLRQSLGRNATIYLEPTKTDCAWCILDTVSKRSSGVAAPGYDWTTHANYVSPYNDKICPNCNGTGYVSTDNTVIVKGTKKDLTYSDKEDSEAGVFRPGTIRFACDLYDCLVDSTDVEGDTYFDRAIKVEFDGETYNVVNVSRSGLRDLYTCRVILERTNA